MNESSFQIGRHIERTGKVYISSSKHYSQKKNLSAPLMSGREKRYSHYWFFIKDDPYSTSNSFRIQETFHVKVNLSIAGDGLVIEKDSRTNLMTVHLASDEYESQAL